MTEYVVLRTERVFQTSEPFSLPSSTLSFPSLPGTFGAPNVPSTATTVRSRVETADMTVRDVADAARDPAVAAIAPKMPLALIKPMVSSAPVAAAGPAWGIDAVGATGSPVDGKGIVVAVLDTGIDAGHPAFAGVTLNQRDFTGSGSADGNGHGTHCAGTIFGRDVGGTRIGVARGVDRALIAKVLDNSGRGSSEMLFSAMNWAAEQGVHVISMSLGFDFPGMVAQLVQQGWPVELATSAALEAYRGNLRMFDAIMGMIHARGELGHSPLVVAASGNESQRPRFEIAASLPAAAEQVISVGALEQVDANHRVAQFSNTLPQISAPGVNISSAKVGGGLVAFNGTSMACPHVAGVATLWWQVVKQSSLPFKADVVRARLFSSARTNTFVSGTDVADRGVGLATCPATDTV